MTIIILLAALMPNYVDLQVYHAHQHERYMQQLYKKYNLNIVELVTQEDLAELMEE